MDTSLIDVDVQPTYVRVMVKGKVGGICTVPTSKATPWTKRGCPNTALSNVKIEKGKPNQGAVFLGTRFYATRAVLSRHGCWPLCRLVKLILLTCVCRVGAFSKAVVHVVAYA